MQEGVIASKSCVCKGKSALNSVAANKKAPFTGRFEISANTHGA